MNIGVFDSGFGGLHVLRGITKELPQYTYVYLGDSARVPYGNRSQKVIYEFTRQAVDFLFKKNCKLVILACNTASSEALRKIQREYLPKHYPNRHVLGVLIPASEEAIVRTKTGRVGVIATQGTISSGAFTRELKKVNTQVKVFTQPCQLLVPIVESGEKHSKAVDLILSSYLEPLLKQNIDTLILGCTHYGILENPIKQIIGSRIKIISQARTVPKKLKAYLDKHLEIEENLTRKKSVVFYSTDPTPTFIRLGSKFFGKTIQVKQATLT